MTNTDLLLTDDEGDRLQVMRANRSARPDQLYAEARRGVYLTREDATALRDYLTAWLGDAGDIAAPTFEAGWRAGHADATKACAHDCVLMDCAPADPTCPRTDHLTSSCQHDELAERSTVADEAMAAVYGDRQADYGHPREDFTRQAIVWTGLLHDKLADGAYLEAEDIARCMIGTKLCRDVHQVKRDNRVDGVGYFVTLDRLVTGK